MSEYSRLLADRVQEYLDSQNWKYQFSEDTGVFSLSLNMKSKLQTMTLRVSLAKNGIRTYGYPPLKAGEENLSRICEYLTRVNYGLSYGNFELDYSDGEVRYKSSHYCGDEVPSLDVVEFIVDMPIFMWNRYGDGFVNLLFADGSPEDEVEKAESS